MRGSSLPAGGGVVKGRPLRVAIVVADYNADVTGPMLKDALAHAEFLGVEVTGPVHVPGVFDMPVVLHALAIRRSIDALAAIGAVVQGETGHDRIIVETVARSIADIAVASGKPIGFGITGPRMNREQARARIGHGKDAVEAAVRVARELMVLPGRRAARSSVHRRSR